LEIDALVLSESYQRRGLELEDFTIGFR